MNKKLLKSEMVLFGDNCETLSKAMDMSNVTLSRKMNGTSEFTRKEISFIKERYELSADSLVSIFFI